MQLSQTEIALIRASYERLLPEVEEASQSFYDRLFETTPHLRGLFRTDMADQGMKFMTTIGVILSLLERPEELGEMVGKLGRAHAALGVEPTHFAPMGEALIATMSETLGPEFTPETAAAWRHAYDALARGMVAAADPARHGTG